MKDLIEPIVVGKQAHFSLSDWEENDLIYRATVIMVRAQDRRIKELEALVCDKCDAVGNNECRNCPAGDGGDNG